jgi:hypothetical protein
MKYVKPKKIYEIENQNRNFFNENINEGSLPTRGNYKIEWPLDEGKYAEWTPKEIADVEKLEYDDGEWGGFSIHRNWTDKNPIQNYNDDFLAQDPGNLFYNKTKVGSMTITSYNVTSGDHVVAKMEVRILKVNNGKKDGYVCFYEFGIDSEYDEQEDACILLDSWSRVLKMLKSLRDKMKSNDGFYKVLDSPAKKSVRFLLGESVNEGKYFTLVAGAGQFLTGADNGETTKDPNDALKFDDIKSATKAAKEFHRKGFPNMVHVMNESVNEGRAPKSWDTTFAMNVLGAYENGDIDPNDPKSIENWDTEYNGGKKPKPAFQTKEIIDYAIATGKKPNGDKMDESVINEAKEISRMKIDMMGSKVLGKIKIGTTFVTDGGNYTVTGFGQKSNAFQEFEAEKDGNPCKVKLTAMYGVKLEVTDDPRSAVYRKEEHLKSILLESLNESSQRTSEINTLEKFIKASKLKRGRASVKDVLEFIHANFEKITGEKYQDAYQFMTDDFIADIISHYKYGEEVIDIWKSMFESEVNEGRKRVRVKRKYTENHPEKSVGKYGPVREAILRHVKENGGTVSKNSLKEFINGMNEDKGTKTSWSWVRRNAKYIKETRFGYKLTKLGERVLNATSLNESIVLNEGQFSWMTQDTGKQIGSERQNTIFVTMFDDKGNRFEEKGYDGYGEFGGKDYYELLAEMNGINKDNVDELMDKCKVRVFGKDLTSKLRQCGIELAFESNKKLAVEAAKITGTVKLKFPALYEFPRDFNKNRHDFHREAESDPNQSWYQEEEEYDDDGYFRY